MRVLQAMAGGARGGAEAFFDRLLPALARRGLEQHVLVRPAPERLAGLRAAGLEVVPLRFGGPLDLPSRWRFAIEVRRYRPDLVLTWMRRATEACPRDGFVHAARLGGYYKLAAFRHCDHLIGNTQALCDYMLQGGWPAARVHYLPNFVSAASLPAVPRAQHETPAEAPLLLALGRLHPWKGFDVLLHALADVPAAYLWLLGEGGEAAALAALAAHLGVADRVRFLGWQQAPEAYYAAADIVVCPSRREALGNVVVEAWAQSRPVLATAAAGPKALIDDGRTGLLVAIDDADALADALRRLIGAPELAAELAAAGHAAYLTEFTEEAVLARYLALFRELAPDGGAPAP